MLSIPIFLYVMLFIVLHHCRWRLLILWNVASHSHNSITSQRTAVLIQYLGLSFLGNSHDISPSLAEIIKNVLNIQNTWELSRIHNKILMTYIFSSIIWQMLINCYWTHLSNTFHWQFKPGDYLRTDRET